MTIEPCDNTGCNDDECEEFDTLFAVVWCGITFSFIEPDDAESFRQGIIHAKSYPDYPPPDNDDRHSRLMQRGFDLYWKMRYYFSAQGLSFRPDVPMLVIRDVEEIKKQTKRREEKIPDIFDFMFR